MESGAVEASEPRHEAKSGKRSKASKAKKPIKKKTKKELFKGALKDFLTTLKPEGASQTPIPSKFLSDLQGVIQGTSGPARACCLLTLYCSYIKG